MIADGELKSVTGLNLNGHRQAHFLAKFDKLFGYKFYICRQY